MATMVKAAEVCNDGTCIFRTDCGVELKVIAFKDGMATVDSSVGHSITSFMRMIAGCFDEISNFKQELLKAFKCNGKTELIGIQFMFEKEKLVVTVEKSDDDRKLWAKWINE